VKRYSGFLLVVLLAAGGAFADETPGAADKEAIAKELLRTEARFLQSVEGLSEAQWHFKAAPDRWSIAECAEHIAAAEPMIRAMVAEAMKKPLAAEVAATAKHDEKVAKAIVDRSQKFKAPEPLQPSSRFGSPAASLDAFRKERAETIGLAKGDADLRTTGDKHFAFGPLDSYGWLLFLSAHSERHTLQIEEVKADPAFPKS
jgi:hypothetical protein